MANDTRYMDVAETAKIIRGELKKAFQGHKFSVTCSRYSMGCSINVSYVDGVPPKAVRAITDRFSGKTFDGSTDSTNYHYDTWNGERVHWPCYAPDVTRRFSQNEVDMLTQIESLIAARWLNPDRNFLECAAWVILGTIDARFETVERAVNRWFHEGCKTYDY